MFRRHPSFQVRPLAAADATCVAALFADFQAEFNQPTELSTTPFTADVIQRDGFGPRPRFRGLLPWPDGSDTPAGFLLWSEGYDTDLAVHGAYVLDLYVAPAWRRHGMARAMLARLAASVRDDGGGFLFWGTDLRNRPAVNLYERVAHAQSGITLFACDGDAFLRLAGEGRQQGNAS